MVKISDAELEVMKAIWKREEATSVEIIEELKDVNWNFNTIRTLIKRLLVKGAIEIIKKEGKTYTYKAVVTENAYKIQKAKELLEKYYNGSLNDFVLEYLESNKNMSMQEIQEIAEKIDEVIDVKKDNNK